MLLYIYAVFDVQFPGLVVLACKNDKYKVFMSAPPEGENIDNILIIIDNVRCSFHHPDTIQLPIPSHPLALTGSYDRRGLGVLVYWQSSITSLTVII